MVESVSAGEENTRLADVELELVVPYFAATCKGVVWVLCHSWSSEETGVHLGWVKGLHHLAGVDEAVVAAWSGEVGSRNWRSSAVATFGVAEAEAVFYSVF